MTGGYISGWLVETLPTTLGGLLGGWEIGCPNTYNTVKPLYSGHSWDRKVSLIERFPHFRGQNVHNPNVWDSTSCPD